MTTAPALTDHVELRTGTYADSVTLLQVSREAQQLPGVATAQVAMATPLNVEVLERMGFAIPGDATVNHLVVAVRLEGDGDLDTVRAAIDRILTESRRAPAATSSARSCPVAIRAKPSANASSGAAHVGIEQPSVPTRSVESFSPITVSIASRTATCVGCSRPT